MLTKLKTNSSRAQVSSENQVKDQVSQLIRIQFGGLLGTPIWRFVDSSVGNHVWIQLGHEV